MPGHLTWLPRLLLSHALLPAWVRVLTLKCVDRKDAEAMESALDIHEPRPGASRSSSEGHLRVNKADEACVNVGL